MDKVEKMDALINALEDYIVLLGKELDEVIPMASVHGWKSSRWEEGKAARRKIQRLKITNTKLERDVQMKNEGLITKEDKLKTIFLNFATSIEGLNSDAYIEFRKAYAQAIHSILELCKEQVPAPKFHNPGYKMESDISWNACRQELLENLERLGR
jgi:hypothetical protein